MSKAEVAGLSLSRLATLDRVMAQRYVDGGMLPGLLTQVYRQGALVHTGMAGHMDLARSGKVNRFCSPADRAGGADHVVEHEGDFAGGH